MNDASQKAIFLEERCHWHAAKVLGRNSGHDVGGAEAEGSP
jgi:hypothetical protein